MAGINLSFCIPQDLFDLFGKDNILNWAFTQESRETILDDDASLVGMPTLERNCKLATEQVISKLYRTRYWQQAQDIANNVDNMYTVDDIPLQLRHAATITAANIMFLARHTTYSADGTGQSLRGYQEKLDAFFSDIERNKISIGGWTQVVDDNAPAVVLSPDNVQAQQPGSRLGYPRCCPVLQPWQ